MARPRHPLDPARRLELLDAAGAEFTTLGFERASLNRILERAAFRKSSFYHYFADKAALFDAVIEEGVTALRTTVTLPDLATTDSSEFWLRLRQFERDLRGAAASNGFAVLVGLLVHLPDAPATPSLVRLRRVIIRELNRALIHGRRSGAIDTTMPLIFQRRLLIAIAVEADRWALTHDVDDAATDAAFTALHRLLAA